MRKRMLDLFCGRFGWGRAFADRGWEVVGVDLVEPPEIPEGCRFIQANALTLRFSDSFRENRWFFAADGERQFIGDFDFICASSPCEQFSVHGMKHFHPNPPYPELGIRLFNHTRQLCENSGLSYVMENVRAAQQFVGAAAHHCGPFYLWGTGVPPLMNQGIKKGMDLGSTTILMSMSIEERRARRKKFAMLSTSSRSAARKALTAEKATIPPELASCVCDYAERLLERAA